MTVFIIIYSWTFHLHNILGPNWLFIGRFVFPKLLRLGLNPFNSSNLTNRLYKVVINTIALIMMGCNFHNCTNKKNVDSAWWAPFRELLFKRTHWCMGTLRPYCYLILCNEIYAYMQYIQLHAGITEQISLRFANANTYITLKCMAIYVFRI